MAIPAVEILVVHSVCFNVLPDGTHVYVLRGAEFEGWRRCKGLEVQL